MSPCLNMLTVFLLFHSFFFVSGMFYRPSYDSGWFAMKAESEQCVEEVFHNLGQIPQLVDVQARATDGPNVGFIFKGTGNGPRDDDQPTRYGGVIYIYNDMSVRIFLPKGNNHGTPNGAAIYTGESPDWHGVNAQYSMEVQVRVRCWTTSSLPATCFNATGIEIQAGSTDRKLTFIERNHALGVLPVLVRVRAQMLDNFPGWYTDAQGSAQANLDRMVSYGNTGGLISGYDAVRIRAWTSSYSTHGKLFGVDDGWGNTGTHYAQARRGSLEMFAWCSLGSTNLDTSFQVGADVIDEQMEIPLDVTIDGWSDDAFVSVTVKVTSGSNTGYTFDGTGAATYLRTNFGQPCAFGGLVFGYSEQLLRVWRPDSSNGAIVCIPKSFGAGMLSQAARHVHVNIRVWTLLPLTQSTFVPTNTGCKRFWLHTEGAAYLTSGFNDSSIEIHNNVTSLHDCSQDCIRDGSCVTFSYSSENVCTLTASTVAMVTASMTSQIWTRVDLDISFTMVPIG